jgi:hypothetical protein
MTVSAPIVLVILVIVAAYFQRFHERFSETTGIIKDVRIKYPTAYYYEYENVEYERRLQNVFGVGKQVRPFWNSFQPPERAPAMITEAFEYAAAEIAKRVRDNKDMRLPNGADTTPIQTVQRRLKGWAMTEDGAVVLKLECIFYRESKYTGKVVEFTVVCRVFKGNVWRYAPMFVRVVGEVSEDHIGMHPVGFSDQPFESQYDAAGATSSRKPTAEDWRNPRLLLSDLKDSQARRPDYQRAVLSVSSLSM